MKLNPVDLAFEVYETNYQGELPIHADEIHDALEDAFYAGWAACEHTIRCALAADSTKQEANDEERAVVFATPDLRDGLDVDGASVFGRVPSSVPQGVSNAEAPTRHGPGAVAPSVPNGGVSGQLTHDERAGITEKGFDFAAHLQRQREFSERTFGPGARTAGVIDHIRKELREIEADPTDASEWADVTILALDGFWRAGYSPEEIIAAIVAKQTKNEGRTWPDWRTAPQDKAIEHQREARAGIETTGEQTNG